MAHRDDVSYDLFVARRREELVNMVEEFRHAHGCVQYGHTFNFLSLFSLSSYLVVVVVVVVVVLIVLVIFIVRSTFIVACVVRLFFIVALFFLLYPFV